MQPPFRTGSATKPLVFDHSAPSGLHVNPDSADLLGYHVTAEADFMQRLGDMQYQLFTSKLEDIVASKLKPFIGSDLEAKLDQFFNDRLVVLFHNLLDLHSQPATEEAQPEEKRSHCLGLTKDDLIDRTGIDERCLDARLTLAGDRYRR